MTLLMRDQENLEKGRKEGHKEGLRKGLAEGRTQRNTEIILSMLDHDIPINMIEKISGCSADEIKKIEKNRQQENEQTENN